MLNAVWQFRKYILTSIINEFRIQFAHSKLGGLWIILQPLAQVLMFALVLSAILSAKLPEINHAYSYPLYLSAGIAAWSLFSELINKCVQVFLVNANLIKKVVFPKLTLPLIITGSALVNNFLLVLCILVIFLLLGHIPTIQIIWLPLLVLATVMLGLGLGMILGILNVFIRDVGQLVPVALQFGFWFTPIVYTKSIIPTEFLPLLELNPLYYIVGGFQNVLVFHTRPDLNGLSYVFILGASLMILAYFMFKNASAELVDEL